MTDDLIAAVIVLGAMLVGFVIYRRFSLGARHPGYIECSIRVSQGSHRGLASRWRAGIGWFEESAFVWTRGPIPSRKLRLKLKDSDLPTREPKLREAWGINPNCVVTQVDTDGATLEIALMPEQLQELRDGLVRR